jgi:CDP-diacylglycerol pyrophosphatase
LAINSVSGRSQNQLHIHIDCLSSEINEVLQRHLPDIGPAWSPFPELLVGHRYMAMRVIGSNLNVNPFRLLALRIPGAADFMGTFSLVVVGATFAERRNGFIILAEHADLAAGNRGSGEELQDHSCEIAKQSSIE